MVLALYCFMDGYVFWDERCHIICKMHVSVCVSLEYVFNRVKIKTQ